MASEVVPLVVVLTSVGGFILAAVWWRRRDRRTLAAVTALDIPVLGPEARAPLRAPAPLDDEASVPRWLRPSVRADRFRQPARDGSVSSRRSYRPAKTFDAPAAAGAERMIVRYDDVELFDEPNEAFARMLLIARAGDEVDVLETTEAWARVSTPSGHEGWLPTMTLSEPPKPPPKPRGKRASQA